MEASCSTNGMNATERNLGISYNPSMIQVFTKLYNLRILFNVVPLLTLGIMGGAILPVPSAFATTGITAATVLMVLIAFCMIYTCDLLLWQSYRLGTRDYETLSEAIGGRWYRIFTEVWLVILMIGTLLGSIVQVGEVCASGITFINSNYDGVLVHGSGRIIMVLGVILMSGFVFLRNLRQLEIAGDFGFIVVLIMVIVIMVHSIQLGLPAIGDGFAYTGFSDLDAFGSAISTFGFQFYISPIMCAMLDEMPPGKLKGLPCDFQLQLGSHIKELFSSHESLQNKETEETAFEDVSCAGVYGIKMMQWSTRLAIGGTAFCMYYLAGFFGAAAYGQDTEGNILENSLGSNTKAQGALNIFMTAYIAIGLVPFEWACRHSVDSLVIQAFPRLNQQKYVMARKVVEAFAVYGVSLGIALAIPGDSAKIIAVTGATGVLIVCYFIPILNHYLMWFGRAKCQRNPELLDSIVKPIRGTINEQLIDDSAHMKVGPIMKDPEAIDTAVTAPVYKMPSVQERGRHEYKYKLQSWPMRIYHLVVPILVFAVGCFASALTLKGLHDD